LTKELEFKVKLFLRNIAREPLVKKALPDFLFERYFFDSKQILYHLSARNRASILDIGCGVGVFSRLLKYMGFQVTAIEHPSVSCSIKDDLKEKEIPLIALDIEHDPLPFPEKSFDAILLLHVIEHLQPTSVVGLLNECSRVLRDGGLLFLETPNQATLYNRLRLLFGKSIYSPIDEVILKNKVSHHREYTIEELKLLIKSSRLKIRNIYWSNFHLYAKREYPKLIRRFYKLIADIYTS
jgi:2-polyprenyl-3-methyl-5-hydroxy-6-metoxy-1,4-benzoquinol methylase